MYRKRQSVEHFVSRKSLDKGAVAAFSVSELPSMRTCSRIIICRTAVVQSADPPPPGLSAGHPASAGADLGPRHRPPTRVLPARHQVEPCRTFLHLNLPAQGAGGAGILYNLAQLLQASLGALATYTEAGIEKERY